MFITHYAPFWDRIFVHKTVLNKQKWTAPLYFTAMKYLQTIFFSIKTMKMIHKGILCNDSLPEYFKRLFLNEKCIVQYSL